MGRPAIDLTGQRFGRWTVLHRAPSLDRRPQGAFWCRCDCGTERAVRTSTLRRGTSQSCGCLHDELSRQRALQHGAAAGGRQTRLYRTWQRMKERCYRPGSDNYEHYGGRGIRVCDRWRDSFENFRADMGQKPSPRHSIDRIDVNGNYEPANCRWATAKEQRRNRRKRTKCRRGHRYTPDNVYRDSRGNRVCRRCTLDWQKADRERKKRAASK